MFRLFDFDFDFIPVSLAAVLSSVYIYVYLGDTCGLDKEEGGHNAG
jgi:hypothetical protein